MLRLLKIQAVVKKSRKSVEERWWAVLGLNQ